MGIILTIKSFIPEKWKIGLKGISNSIAAQQYIDKIKKNPNAIVIFDVPSHGNIGDQAILLAEIKYLKNNFKGIEIIAVPSENSVPVLKYFKMKTDNQQVICIHGGGFLGSIWNNEIYPEVMKCFNTKNIIVFPQTIFYEQTEYGNSKLKKEKELFENPGLKLFVREEQSQKYAQNILCTKNPNNCILVPDIVLSYETDISYNPMDKVITCLRNDKEKVLSKDFIEKLERILMNNNIQIEKTDMCVPHAVAPSQREKLVNEKLKQLSTAKFVITDRLHCMIFCTLTGTPCIAFDNSSKKVQGVYDKWLNNIEYIVFADTEEKAFETIKEWVLLKQIKYKRYTPKDLEDKFQPLKDAIKSYMN